MGIVYSVERLPDIISELPEIFYQHWLDIALDKAAIALNPAWEEYLRLDALGVLHITTMRDDQKLIGYVFSLLHPHLHYKQSLTAYTDLMYIKREYTRTFGVLRYRTLIRFSEKKLRDLGVQKRYLMTKVEHDLTPLFAGLGYRLIEKISAKLL